MVDGREGESVTGAAAPAADVGAAVALGPPTHPELPLAGLGAPRPPNLPPHQPLQAPVALSAAAPGPAAPVAPAAKASTSVSPPPAVPGGTGAAARAVAVPSSASASAGEQPQTPQAPQTSAARQPPPSVTPGQIHQYQHQQLLQPRGTRSRRPAPPPVHGSWNLNPTVRFAPSPSPSSSTYSSESSSSSTDSYSSSSHSDVSSSHDSSSLIRPAAPSSSPTSPSSPKRRQNFSSFSYHRHRPSSSSPLRSSTELSEPVSLPAAAAAAATNSPPLANNDDAPSAVSARRRQRVLDFPVPTRLSMPPGSQSGMQNRLSSSSSPSLPPNSSPSVSAAAAPVQSAVVTDTNATLGPPAAATQSSLPSPSSSSSTTNNGDGRANTGANANAAANARRANANNAGPSAPGRRSSGSPAPSSTSATPTSRSSLLSRFKIPISLPTRTRHITDFYIQTDKSPRHSYSPGDHVRGTVHLTVSKPVRITHLTVSLNGYVQVVKDASAGSKTLSSSVSSRLPQGGSHSPQYHGNGLASLFQDEQVLSGEGRLDVSKYQFGFDLVFPSHGLPSSISFGLGTIAYMVTATLTRPTSIAPTISCDRDVQLMDKIDIGRVQPPRPRPIFLEPISKHKRRKRSAGLERATPTPAQDLTGHEGGSEAGSVAPSSVTADDASRNRSTIDLRHTDQSDIRSDISAGSVRSVSTGGLSRAELAQVAEAKQQAVDDKTITATIAVLRGGCLPGDTVPVRITVQHIERIKSMNGVIVTLFRRGKVDSNPPASLFDGTMSDEDKRKLNKDESYPRSRTGLGGLSLSSAGSTRVFRQDLDQTMSPLIINPATLQASVTLSVKLPEEPFPTTMGVPGDMIAFRYYVEVLVDLKGNMWSSVGAQDSRLGSTAGGMFDGVGANYNPRRGVAIRDTEAMRRAKSVVAVAMEVIVGTTDSSRTSKPSRLWTSPSIRPMGTSTSEDDQQHGSSPNLGHNHQHPNAPYQYQFHDQSQPDIAPPLNGQLTNSPSSYNPNGQRFYNQSPMAQPGTGPPHPYHPYPMADDYRGESPAYFPPPQMPEPHTLSDKERVRQAEMRLLPSQPPDPNAASGSASVSVSASAPSAPDADGSDDHGDASEADETPTAGPSAPPPLEYADQDASAPTHDDVETPPAGAAVSGEDKQERERRRLMNEASAPPEIPDDMDRVRGEPSSPPDADDDAAEPSAPILDEEVEQHQHHSLQQHQHHPAYGAGAGPSNSRSSHDDYEQLPAYVQ